MREGEREREREREEKRREEKEPLSIQEHFINILQAVAFLATKFFFRLASKKSSREVKEVVR